MYDKSGVLVFTRNLVLCFAANMQIFHIFLRSFLADLRKVLSVYFTFMTFTKGRWVGERILDVFFLGACLAFCESSPKESKSAKIGQIGYFYLFPLQIYRKSIRIKVEIV